MLEELMLKLEELNNNVNHILELQLQQSNALSTTNDVARYLGKSTRTVRNYIKDGKLKINKHFYKDENGKNHFIPEAIIEFRSTPRPINVVQSSNSVTKVMHPVASQVLKGVA